MPETSPAPQPGYARIYIRTKCDHPIQLTYVHAGANVVLPARCTNLCIGGFFADLSEPLEIGQKVAVEFLADESSSPLRLSAEVRHVNGKDTGFQFLEHGEADKEALRLFFSRKSDLPGIGRDR